MSRAWWHSEPRVADATVKPLIGEGEVYGWEVTAAFRDAEGNEVVKRFRSKGKSLSKALRVPVFKAGFLRNVEIHPYTREQWLRVFGEGRM